MEIARAEIALLLTCVAAVAGCTGEPRLPTSADLYGDRDCECVTSGDCSIAEAAEGKGEDRNLKCKWEGRAARQAVCTYETRFIPDDPELRELPWSSVTVRLKHMGNKGWCWTERS